MENEFKDIIIKLERLEKVAADKKLIGRFENLLIPSLQNRTNKFFSLLVYKFVPLLFLFLALGSTLVIASENSRPGELLYPVKAAIFKIQPQASIAPTPTPLPFVTPSPSPSLSPVPEVKGQSVRVDIKAAPVPSVSALPLPTVTPTIVPAPSLIPASTPQTQINVQASILPAPVSVDIQSPAASTLPAINLDVSLGEKKLIKIGL